jgi:heat shock protein HslJ
MATALSLVVLPGSSLAQEDTATLEGVEWTLSEFSRDGDLGGIPDGVNATLLLLDGQATGNSGCNPFFGAYQIDGPSITFDETLGLTRMACTDDAQVVEEAYLAALTTVTSWSIEADSLQLRADPGTSVLVYHGPTTEIAHSDIGAILAALGALNTEFDRLRVRVDALEGADASARGGNGSTPKNKRPAAPRRQGKKVQTVFPDWMRDEFRPENQRSDEKNRESITWRDRSDDEEGFLVYARRGYCELKPGTDLGRELTEKDFRRGRGKPVLIDELPANATNYVPDHAGIDAQLPAAPESPYSSDQSYDLVVSAFNTLGESKKTLLGSYYLTPEFNCP